MRPRRYDNLVQLGVRVPAALRDQLNEAAVARDLSAAYLVRRAIEDYLARMIPPEEIQWTKPDSDYVLDVMDEEEERRYALGDGT